MHLLIDASNIKSGGGFTHLLELLANVSPDKYRFNAMDIIGGNQLNQIPDYTWLRKIIPQQLVKGGFISETLWKINDLPNIARTYDIVFAPGGTFYSKRVRYISMSQNMLVFQAEERKRFGLSLTRLRLVILERIQKKSFKGATGIIFISRFAENYITKKIGKLSKTKIINHGVSSRFKGEVKKQKSIDQYSLKRPIKLLYISTIDVYKHQIELIEAIKILKTKQIPIELHLIGDATAKNRIKLKKTTRSVSDYVHYHDVQPYNQIESFYQSADIFVFPSSCENMPNILIEAMASGLPIASSNMGPMGEFLKDGGWYFNPTDIESISNCIEEMLMQPEARYIKALKSKQYAENYDWEKCATETFEFLEKIAAEKI